MKLNEAKISKQLINTVMNDQSITFGFEAEFFYVGMGKFLKGYLGRDQKHDESSGWYTKTPEDTSWHDVIKYFYPLSVSADTPEDNLHVLKQRLTDVYKEITNDTELKSTSEMFATLRTELSMPQVMALLQAYPKNGFMVTEPQQDSLSSVFRRGDVSKAGTLGKLSGVPYRTYDDPEEAFSVTGDGANREIFYEIFAHQLQKYLGEPVVFTIDSMYVNNISGNYSRWVVTNDPSLEETEMMYSDEIGIEIISPKMSLADGLVNLQKIFAIIDNPELLGFKNFEGKTDIETGLHINLGIGNIENLDPVKLFLLMGDEQAAADWGREFGIYTGTMLPKILSELSSDPAKAIPLVNSLISKMGTSDKDIENAKKALSGVMKTGKDLSLNLSKLTHGYVEFRHIGGEGYHTAFDYIRKSILGFASWMYVASHDEIYKKDYYRALFKVIQMIKTGDSEELPPEFVDDVETEKAEHQKEVDKRLAFFNRGRQASSRSNTMNDSIGVGQSPGPTGYFSGEVENDKDWWTVDLP